jgi:hypothetical protein
VTQAGESKPYRVVVKIGLDEVIDEQGQGSRMTCTS